MSASPLLSLTLFSKPTSGFVCVTLSDQPVFHYLCHVASVSGDVSRALPSSKFILTDVKCWSLVVSALCSDPHSASTACWVCSFLRWDIEGRVTEDPSQSDAACLNCKLHDAFVRKFRFVILKSFSNISQLYYRTLVSAFICFNYISLKSYLGCILST